MAFALNQGVRIHYDSIGSTAGYPVVLLGGAGRPASDFDALFCEPLVSAGLRVIRVDSRDTGRSDGFDHLPTDLGPVRDHALGQGGRAPAYDVQDMAGDLQAVLDAEEIATCHIVGRSLGAQVAQRFAIDHPWRCSALCLIMASSRSIADRLPDAVLARLGAEWVTDGDAYVARSLATAQVNGIAADFDPAQRREEAIAAWRHGIRPGATARHFAASMMLGDLRPALHKIKAPALIVHGLHDPLLPIAMARETAAGLKRARLIEREDMGHDGPDRLRRIWGDLVADFLGGLG
ncbi:alpha/beta fold hydrolase [Pseudooceanicola nitratireducens]|uniref:alpha/beta fold hydrolase n=1 Tax=Pseudooceanicola nitratireducens TaxID=517719 RepID=UPI0023F037CC|nr:alpha/beta hydrolase [Pseudooceanicola nitratireducens]